jgi:hypothetical protein
MIMRGESSAAMRSRMCYIKTFTYIYTYLPAGPMILRTGMHGSQQDVKRDLRMLMGSSIEELLESSEGGGGPQDEWLDYMYGTIL